MTQTYCMGRACDTCWLCFVVGTRTIKSFLFTILNLFYSFSFHLPTYFNLFWIIQEVLITLFLKKKIYLFIYLAVLGLSCCVPDLVPWPGIEPGPHAFRARSLNHWTTKEVPVLVTLNCILPGCLLWVVLVAIASLLNCCCVCFKYIFRFFPFSLPAVTFCCCRCVCPRLASLFPSDILFLIWC